MFGIFKKKKKEKRAPQLFDLLGNEINSGDKVTSERYDLGSCVLELDGLHYYYTNSAGLKISYTKMIDAITGHQKVLKADE